MSSESFAAPSSAQDESVTAGAKKRAPIALALDAPDLQTACVWASAAAPHISYVKVGLETYLRDGVHGLEKIRAAAGPDVELFLDLKLHDIPNTVAGAARSVAKLQPSLLTVHAAGGAAMIRAAADALPGTRIAAVTVLTSLSAGDLAAIGLAGPPIAAVRRLASVAVAAGARAIVCSPLEVRAVREKVGPDVLLVVPGVRLAGTETGDQQRVSTPEQALADGADVLVIGRPITRAPDPGDAARQIAESLRR